LTRCAINPFKRKKKDSDIQELLQNKSIVAEMELLDDDENVTEAWVETVKNRSP
jgi:hypothetical protein